MLFSLITQVFARIEQTESRTEITKLLAALFSELTSDELSIVCNLSLGQLYPPYITTQFNIAVKTMIKVLARICSVAEDTIAQAIKKKGDIGDVLAAHSWQGEHDLSLTEVYKELVALEKIVGVGSQEDKMHYLKDFLHKLSPLQAKYIIRIILAKLRLGFSDMTIIDALSWMVTGNKSLHDSIEGAYNICADLGLIAKTLKNDGIQALESMKIHVGIPIRPAAAERLPSAAAIIQKLGTCVAEPKFDGFRVQIHVEHLADKKTRIHFYSRNLQDMSAMFPDLTEAFTAIHAQSLVCEGEAICFDPNTGSFLPFQETVKRKRKHNIEQVSKDFPIKIFLFDLLYLDGISLLDIPLDKRRKKLLDVTCKISTDLMQVTEERIVETAEELEHYFAENVAAGLEGLVVKRIDAPYQAGTRNFNWIKLKRQEEGELEDTIDCVILGYYAGKGKRASFGIGALLVGIYNKQADMFQTIAKIGTGLSDQEWRRVKEKCDETAVKQAPNNVEYHKNLTPDVWTEPTIVCQVRADEITLSPVHTAGKTAYKLGYALRFPRFMGYREDKNSFEATTDSEIDHLYHDQSR